MSGGSGGGVVGVGNVANDGNLAGRVRICVHNKVRNVHQYKTMMSAPYNKLTRARTFRRRVSRDPLVSRVSSRDFAVIELRREVHKRLGVLIVRTTLLAELRDAA